MSNWTDICHIDDILPNSGRAALYQGQQVAIFRIRESGNEAYYAVGNYDPKSDANVIARGIVGSQGDKRVVASPIYKQHYCLQSGACIEDEAVTLPTWKVRVDGDRILLA